MSPRSRAAGHGERHPEDLRPPDAPARGQRPRRRARGRSRRTRRRAPPRAGRRARDVRRRLCATSPSTPGPCSARSAFPWRCSSHGVPGIRGGVLVGPAVRGAVRGRGAGRPRRWGRSARRGPLRGAAGVPGPARARQVLPHDDAMALVDELVAGLAAPRRRRGACSRGPSCDAGRRWGGPRPAHPHAPAPGPRPAERAADEVAGSLAELAQRAGGRAGLRLPRRGRHAGGGGRRARAGIRLRSRRGGVAVDPLRPLDRDPAHQHRTADSAARVRASSRARARGPTARDGAGRRPARTAPAPGRPWRTSCRASRS